MSVDRGQFSIYFSSPGGHLAVACNLSILWWQSVGASSFSISLSMVFSPQGVSCALIFLVPWVVLVAVCRSQYRSLSISLSLLSYLQLLRHLEALARDQTLVLVLQAGQLKLTWMQSNRWINP
jgi:hypothetical protein